MKLTAGAWHVISAQPHALARHTLICSIPVQHSVVQYQCLTLTPRNNLRETLLNIDNCLYCFSLKFVYNVAEFGCYWFDIVILKYHLDTW